MTKQIFNLKVLFLTIFAGLTLASCNSDDDNNIPQNTRLAVRMIDAPGDYDKVNIDVQQVMIQRTTTGTAEEGWVSLTTKVGIYDLLELTGGVSELLVDQEIPAGYVGQIRLILGNDNSVVVDGQQFALATPSAQQSGLQLNIDKDLEPGESYEYIFDFDVDNSIVNQGGGYILKPVIRLIADSNMGMITGEVHPTSFRSLVTATNANQSISAYTNANGKFALFGVPAGTYRITVQPDASSNLPVKTQDNVSVSEDGTVDLGTLYLE